TTAPIQAVYGGRTDAFAAKINNDGLTAAYATYLGGNDLDVANGIAVDSSGNVYITGSTQSPNFPTASPLQTMGGGGSMQTLDGGTTWTPANSGLQRGTIGAIAFDPTNASIAYASDTRAAYKTTDGGLHWTQIIDGASFFIAALLVDPTSAQTIYGGDSFGSGVRKSTDGGTSFTSVSSGLTNANVRSLAIDPTNHLKLLAGTTGGIFITTNGGTSWTATSQTSGQINGLAFDGIGNAYAALSGGGGIRKSTDGG